MLHNKFTEFLELKNTFLSSYEGSFELDPYGFCYHDGVKHNVHILICALTHGNEVIGLEVVNDFLRKVLNSTHAPFSFAVLLNNVAAYQASTRYIDKDLNRCFGYANSSSLNKYEHQRSLQIEAVIERLKPQFIFDLHQTVEPSKEPFFIIPEDKNLIQLSQKLSQQWPVICFDTKQKFSQEGKTLLEYSKELNIPCLAVELGQKGFNEDLAHLLSQNIYNLKFPDFLASSDKPIKPYYKIVSTIIDQHNDLKLKPGFSSLDPIAKNQVIAIYSNGQNFISPQDGYILFPNYSNNKNENVVELGHIIKKISTLT